MAEDTATPAPLPLELGATIAARYARSAARAASIEADLAAAIAPLKAAAEKKLAPIAARMERDEAEAKLWWAQHGHTVRGKKKSAEIAGVVMGTRLSAAKLEFAHGDDSAAAAVLLKRRLVKLLRRSVGLDKKAIGARLAEEAEKPEDERVLAELGFSLAEQVDTFFIEPATHTGRKG